VLGPKKKVYIIYNQNFKIIQIFLINLLANNYILKTFNNQETLVLWGNTSEAVTTRKVDNFFKGEIFKSTSRGLHIINI